MERARIRRMQLVRRRVMRWLVIAAIYLGLLTGTVTLVLGSVWFVKHTVYGWWMLLGLCLFVGGWLFFRLSQEGQMTRPAVS